jgi:hypothetical protein
MIRIYHYLASLLIRCAYAPPVGYIGAAIMPALFIPSSYGVAR